MSTWEKNSYVWHIQMLSRKGNPLLAKSICYYKTLDPQKNYYFLGKTRLILDGVCMCF